MLWILTHSTKNPISELLFHDYLQTLGLSIQSRLRILICNTCQSALLPTSVARHFSEKHKGTAVQVDQKQIIAIATQWNLCKEMPIVKGPVIQIGGLPLIDGCVKCPICSGVFSRTTMPSHHSSQHPDTPTPSFATLLPIHAQQLNKGQHKTLFEVIVIPTFHEPAVSNIILEHLRTSRDNIMTQYSPSTLDARALSPWMQYTGWQSHVQPFQSPELIALVGMPRKDETALGKLAAAVTAIYDAGYKQIDQTNIIVLQKLKSDDLEEKCVIHQFDEYSVASD